MDKVLDYIRMRRTQLRIEIERGSECDFPQYRWGIIEGELEAMNEIERIINADKNAEMGE